MMFKKLLALGPHTDDIELGAGGTLSRMLEEGTEVHVAIFSSARESLPSGLPDDTLKNECFDALKFMGISKNNILLFDYPVRKLHQYRQDVLEHLVSLRNQVNPDCVLVPSTSDVHQDHQVLSQEGLRAFKHSTMLGYELPWNHFTFDNQAFIRLERRHVEKKNQALQYYQSQIQKGRPYFDKEFSTSLSHVRGVQVNSNFAESFQVLRLVL